MPDLSLFPPSATIAGDDLQVGGCSLREIAERFGTPAYVIDEQALRSRAREYLAAFTRRASPQPGLFRREGLPVGVDDLVPGPGGGGLRRGRGR